MSGDNMKLNLDFDIKVDGEKKLDTLDKTVERLTRNLEKLSALGKSAGAALNSVTNPGRAPSRGTGNGRGSAADRLIDRDVVRTLKMKLRYRKDEATQAIRAQQAEQRQARQAFREKLTFNTRLAAQRLREDNAALRAVRAEQRATEQAFRQKLSFATRMENQRSREAAQAAREVQRGIRETSRLRASEARTALAAERELVRERSRGMSRVSRGLGRAGSGARGLAGSTAAAGLASAYAAERTVDSLTRSGVTIDNAITQAQIHVFGQQSTADSRKSAEALRKKLMPVASRLGTRTADLMQGYVEAAQAGVADELLDVVTESGTKFAKMNNLSVPDVLEQSGYALNGLKAFGAVTNDVVKRYYDETSYLIATTSANRKELLSFTRTGLSSGASVGMNMEQSLAFGGAITAAGGEGQQASRMLSTQGSRVAEWRNKYRDIVGKHHKSANDRQFLDAVNILGYRSGDDMADSFSNDFFGSLVNVQEKLKNISDPLKRKAITAQLFGKEFGALLDGVIMGGGLKEMISKMSGASGYLNKSWDKFTGNLGFLLDKIGVALGNITETMGLALKPLWIEVSAWVDRFQGFDRMGEAVTNFTNGLIKGLGGDSITDLLNKIVGDPGQFRLNMSSVYQWGKGFGEGLASIGSAIRGLASAVMGTSGDAETLGRLSGKIVALGAALAVLAPALIVMSSLVSLVSGLGLAASGLARILGGAGVGASASAGLATGAATVAGGWAKIGVIIAAAAVEYLAPRIGELLKKILGEAWNGQIDKGVEHFTGGETSTGAAATWVLEKLGILTEKKAEGGWQDPGESKRLKGMADELKKNTAATLKNTEATKDEARKATETKAAEIKAAEQKKLNELVSIRNPTMTGSVGSGYNVGGPAGFNSITEGGNPNGTGMPTANGGVTNPGLSGDVAARAKEAHDFFRAQGYSEEATAGILASLSKESNFTPNARGDGGGAHGIAQWHADRRRQILAGTGIDVSRASFSDQLRAVAWEMKHGDAGAQRAHRLLMNPNISAREAGGAFVQHFERPKRDERAERGALAEGFHRQYNGGGTGGGTSLPGAGGSSNALDNARSLVGAGPRQAANALGRKMSSGQWCADFVNGVLEKAGIKGSGSSIATSYRKWGAPVTDGVQAGDVVVTHRGRAAGQVGGHVGIATGQTRMHNGRLQYGTVSGNHSGLVGEGWENASGVDVRRGITSGMPQGSGRQSSKGGGNVTVNIAAVHGGDPKANGEEIGRQVRQSLNTHYGDVDPWGQA